MRISYRIRFLRFRNLHPDTDGRPPRMTGSQKGTRLSGYFTMERHERLREQVREFAQAEVAPQIPAMESSRAVHDGLARLVARQGWIGVTVARRYGGMGFGGGGQTIIIQKM